MTIHYHGTPITPVRVLMGLAGRHFCVSHAEPKQARYVHEIGQSVMLDNGAFTKWKGGGDTDWPAYYKWCDFWLDFPTTWAVIPDVIDGGPDLQDDLLALWPFSDRGAPVWHMDEPLDRLLSLCDAWPRVCIGSTAEYSVVLSDLWRARIDAAFSAVSSRHRRLPWLHMLRGMQLAGKRWPFASLDSTDVGRNHNRGHAPTGALASEMPEHERPETRAQRMAAAWDAKQCPARWTRRPEQGSLGLEIPEQAIETT